MSFTVKVGAVSGADQIFTHPKGNMEFVCSKTVETGETRRMLYGIKHPHLEKHKDRTARPPRQAFRRKQLVAMGPRFSDQPAPAHLRQWPDAQA
jgi:hypothetical protein